MIFAFRARYSQGEMYIGHCRLSVPHCIPTLLHGPGCNWGDGRGFPLVVHYWADLQSVHRFRCYGDIHVCKLIALYTADVCACTAIWLIVTVVHLSLPSSRHHLSCDDCLANPRSPGRLPLNGIDVDGDVVFRMVPCCKPSPASEAFTASAGSRTPALQLFSRDQR